MTDQPRQLFVGTYTRTTKSEGIYRVVGKSARLAAICDNPSYLERHPGGSVVYAVNEISDFDSGNTGAVTAYFIQSNGQLTEMNQQPSMGADPCHITVSANSNYIVVSNYSGGTFTTFPLDDDGYLDQFISLSQHTGQSIHPERQQSAHVHSSLLSTQEDMVLVADLGADQLVQYAISAEGQVQAEGRQAHAVQPGAGPRLMIQIDERIYLVNELANTISVHDSNTMSVLEERSTLPEDCQATSIASHIAASRDGKYLYVSNRGFDSIAVFCIKPKLSLIQVINSGGQHPRHFTLSPDELELYVANQHSDEIVCFNRDPVRGTLTEGQDRIQVPSPTCLLFA